MRIGTRWVSVVAWASGKHTNFRVEGNGFESQLWVLLAGRPWPGPASLFSIAFLETKREWCLPWLVVSISEMFHAREFCKIQSALNCWFLLHLLNLYLMSFSDNRFLLYVMLISHLLPPRCSPPNCTSIIHSFLQKMYALGSGNQMLCGTLLPVLKLPRQFLKRLLDFWRQGFIFPILEGKEHLFVEVRETGIMSLCREPDVQYVLLNWTEACMSHEPTSGLVVLHRSKGGGRRVRKPTDYSLPRHGYTINDSNNIRILLFLKN